MADTLRIAGDDTTPPAKDDPALARTISASGDAAVPEPALARGATFGRYVVLDRLGEGGMGVVYKAYDPELDRRVAVKLVNSSSEGDASEWRARLLREAQAMARLSHPNVIAVHDVGTYGDQVFIAMELVDGVTLRTWQEAPGRTWSEIVAMYTQAARGLAAAHDAGIVHRDFKGDNVLVGKDGRARVLDFGLAHAAGTDHPRSERATDSHRAHPASALETPITRNGTLLGTPRYMSPEQFDGERINPPADQFGFCAAFYEALYGEPPFEGNDLLTLTSSVRSGRIRAARGNRDVPGWVRQILVRGLSVKPADRHPSMHALIAALERDPALARRRWIGAVATVLAVAAAGGGVLLVRAGRPPLCPSAAPLAADAWSAARKDEMAAAFRATGKPYAEDAIRSVTSALDTYAKSWIAMHDETCAATRIRGEQSSELMDLRMSCLSDRLGTLSSLGGQLSHADATMVEKAVQAADSLPPLADCADATTLRAPRLPDDPAARQRVAAVRGELAELRGLLDTAMPADVVPRAQTDVAKAREVGFRPLEAEALLVAAQFLAASGDDPGAIAALDEAQLAAEAAHADSLAADALIAAVRVDARDKRDADASRAAKHAHALLEGDPAPDLRLATLLVGEAISAENQGHLDDAIALARRAGALREQLLPPFHLDLAEPHQILGGCELEKGDFEGALADQRRALEIRENALGPMHPLVAAPLNNMGNVLAHMRRYEDAVAVFQRSLDIKLVASHGGDSRAVANGLCNLSIALVAWGKNADGLDEAQRCLAMRQRLYGPDHLGVAGAYETVADPQLSLGKWDDAIGNLTCALAIRQRSNEASDPSLPEDYAGIGKALLGKGDAKRALPTLEKALHLASAREGMPLELARIKADVARALVATHGDTARARTLAQEARATFAAMNYPELVAKLDAQFPTP